MADKSTSRGRRIARLVAFVAGGIIVALIALLVLIDTRPGHRLLLRQLSGFETASGLGFSADAINGSIYSALQIEGLKVRDPKGVFLTVDRAALDWRPLAYLGGKIDIDSLAANETRLLRTPELREVPSDPDAPILPDIDIRVGALDLQRIVIEPAVTGQRHIARLKGRVDIADGRALVKAQAGAIRAPGVAGGDTLVIDLDANPDANRLQIAARLDAPAGGLVDSFTGLDRPARMILRGNGDWAAWNGGLSMTAGDTRLADMRLTARDGTFGLRGQARPGVLLDGPAARLAEPVLDLAGSAKFKDRRANLQLAARSNAVALAVRGLVDLGESRFGNLKINAALLQPGSIAENLRGRQVALAATLDGPFGTPLVSYDLRAAELAFGNTGVEQLVARGDARLDGDRILIPVNATVKRVTGLNQAAGGLLTNVRVQGDLAWSNGRLLSDNLRLRSSRLDATAIVVADVAEGRYTGALKGRVNDYQVDGIGRIALVTDAELVSGRDGGFGIRGGLRVTTRTIDNATLRSTLGGNAVTTARFGFSSAGTVSLTDLRLNAPDFRITGGRGSYNIESGAIDLRAQGQSTQYGPLDIVATGTLERPRATLNAARPGLGVGMTKLQAKLEGVAAGYAVNATAQSSYGPVSANVILRTRSGPIAVDIRQVRFAGIDGKGTLTQQPSGPFAGRLTLAGSGLNGTVLLSAAGANQQADVRLNANGAVIPGDSPILIGTGLVDGRVVLLPSGPTVDGRFAFRDIRQGENIVNLAEGRATIRNGVGNAALIAKGRWQTPFDFAGQAQFSPQRILANARGSASGVPIRFERPVTLTSIANGWRIEPAQIAIGEGRVKLQGDVGSAMNIQADLNSVNIALAQAFMPGLGLGGRASGTIRYATPAAGGVPDLRARIDIRNLTRTAAYVVSNPVDIALLATLNGSGGDLRALVRRGGTTVGRLQARLSPLGSGATLTDRLSQSALSGGIRYNGPAAVLWTLTGIADQNVSGPLIVAADFGGRLASPTVRGFMRAQSLRYENETIGTVITNIALTGQFSQSSLTIQSLTGRAGDGTVSGSGMIGLDAASGFPVRAEATFDNAQLARSNTLGATATGSLSINGTQTRGGTIKGDIRIPEARYRIAFQGASEVVDLTGVRRRTDRPELATKPVAPPARWDLDIRVRADNRIYVEGMGLEADWAADLRMTGTTAQPSLVGDLRVIRGTYSFAGRRFELDEGGEVHFDGGDMSDPTLALSASTTVEGVTAIINIGGRAQQPDITFTSSPTLPQDEVLSRILFGESVTSLSPTQALQLVAALNSLRGGGNGLNPLGKLRSATGIDRLRILGADDATGRGTSLAAGEYLTDDIYVEIITDARGFTATQLEVALSRTLSILSQTGSFGGSNIRLRYSKDY